MADSSARSMEAKVEKRRDDLLLDMIVLVGCLDFGEEGEVK